MPDGWNIAFYIFTLFRGVFLFAVIVLIGTGWSYMTPFLGDRDAKVLLAVIPLQVRVLPLLCPLSSVLPFLYSAPTGSSPLSVVLPVRAPPRLRLLARLPAPWREGRTGGAGDDRDRNCGAR